MPPVAHYVERVCKSSLDMIARLMRRWRAMQRAMDLRLLWPVCLREAPDRDMARRLFLCHCMMDPAWRRDFTEDEIIEYVRTL